MEYYHNPGKDLDITVEGRRYLRHGIRTHLWGWGRTICPSSAGMWPRCTSRGTVWR